MKKTIDELRSSEYHAQLARSSMPLFWPNNKASHSTRLSKRWMAPYPMPGSSWLNLHCKPTIQTSKTS